MKWQEEEAIEDAYYILVFYKNCKCEKNIHDTIY